MSENNKDAFNILSNEGEVIGDTEYFVNEDSSTNIFDGSSEDRDDDIEKYEESINDEVDKLDEEEYEEEYEEDDDLEEEYEEDEEEEDEDDLEVEFDTNPFTIIAKNWKEQGHLPEDLEIDEDFSAEDLDTAMYDHMTSTVSEALRNEILDEIKEEEGLNDELIDRVKKLYYGLGEEEVTALDQYRALAQVQLDELDEDFEDKFIEFGAYYYMDDGVPKDKAVKMAAIDLEDNPSEFLKEYQSYFANRSIEYKQQLDAYEQQKRQAYLNKQKEELDRYNEALENRRVGDRTFSEAQAEFLRSAIYDRNHYIPDGRGGKRRVTLYEKKRWETENDPLKQMERVFDFLLSGEEVANDSESSVTKAKKKVLKELNKAITVKTGKSKKGKRKKNRQSDNRNTRYGKEVAEF